MSDRTSHKVEHWPTNTPGKRWVLLRQKAMRKAVEGSPRG